jgi:uncharacterized protein (TIGR02266 family)
LLQKRLDPKAVRKLEVDLSDRREFTRRYLSEIPTGGLLVDVDDPIDEEDLVELQIRVGDTGFCESIRGVVLWYRRDAGQTGKAGIGFLPGETEKRERLWASQSQTGPGYANITRLEPRNETTLRVAYQTATDLVIDYASNISTEGLYVRSEQPPTLGANILFKLYPPGEPDPIPLPGKVAWRRPGQGFGVRFSATDTRATKRLHNLVHSPIFEEASS